MTEQINKNEIEPISKTHKKKEMKALQEMGKRLVRLSERQLKDLKLPSRLFDAVLDAKAIKSHGAKHRQMKFIGAVIRDIDPEPIRTGLARIDQKLAIKDSAFHKLERLRDRLMSGDSNVFGEIHAEYPFTDRQRLKQLVRNAINEKKTEKGVKHHRVLFRYLKALSETGGDGAPL